MKAIFYLMMSALTGIAGFYFFLQSTAYTHYEPLTNSTILDLSNDLLISALMMMACMVIGGWGVLKGASEGFGT